MSERLLTPEELAVRLNIPLWTAWRLGREGPLRRGVVRIGRCMRFRESVVDEFIAGGGGSVLDHAHAGATSP